ncbi:MAG: hypothetical protein CMM48_13405 [Rhodospirillaceae bacterium]|nr:hypothetical protein [Rhodospirillaceae bacterium]
MPHHRKKLAVLLAFLFATTIAAFPVQAIELLLQNGNWETLEVPGKRASVFRFLGPQRLEVEADRSVAFLVREIRPTIQTATAKASWRWRVDRDFLPKDLFRTGEDDRPIAIHLWFDVPGAETDFFPFLATLFGYPRISHVLTYVWGGLRQPETLKTNPYHPNGKILILRHHGTALRTWHTEMRNLRADIKRAFGKAVGIADLRYIAISADTDDTAQHSRAQVSGLKLDNVAHE